MITKEIMDNPIDNFPPQIMNAYAGCGITSKEEGEWIFQDVDSRYDGCRFMGVYRKGDPEDFYITNIPEEHKLMLIPFEFITDDHLFELMAVAGWAPHLLEHGLNDFKTGLMEGSWDDSGIQLDFFTMAQIINKARELQYDMDDLIPLGLAVNLKECSI